MKFSVLGSGSRGNSVYVESGKTGLLIDAGFSGKEIQARLEFIGRDLANVNGICITHEHHDHISGVGVVSRRCKIPAYANPGTFAGADNKLGKLFARKEFETGEIIQIRDLQVRSFRISHDTKDPVGFVISNGESKVGYCTDTGKVSHLMAARMAKCDAIILEFNHDLEMLRNGPYPLPLQQRVRSSRGHLCNEDAGDFLSQLIGGELQVAVLAHLSEKNNTPDLAKTAALQSVQNWGNTSLVIAAQNSPLPLIDLENHSWQVR